MSPLRHALGRGLSAFGRLFVVVAPVYAAVVILMRTPVLPWIAAHLAPAMGAFGLPGTAALPLVLGATINFYAMIAACQGLGLSAGAATTLALIGAFAHNLIVEGTVLLRLSKRGWTWIAVRIGIAIAAGLVFGPIFTRLWPSNDVVNLAHGAAAARPLWADLIIGGGRSLLTLFAIVVPIVTALDLLQSYGWLGRLRRPLAPILRFLGFDERASEALLAGIFFGLVYGAGVIINRVEVEGLDEDQVGRLCLTLVLCHAIVEDTLLFLPLGAVLWPIVVIRVAVAFTALLVMRLLTAPRTATESPA